MKTRLSITSIVLFALSCLAPMACPPPTPVTPSQDAGPAASGDAGQQEYDRTPCGRACTRRTELGCPVGPNCMKTCLEVLGQRMIAGFDPECIANAADKASVSRCPGVKCP